MPWLSLLRTGSLRLVWFRAAQMLVNAMDNPNDPMSQTLPDPAPRSRPAIPSADIDRIYADLRRHAQNLLAAERPEHTLQATALVHEAMVKLLGEFGEKPLALPPDDALSERRRVLFSMLSLRMRQVLVEHARHRNAGKRPGRWTRSPLHEAMQKVDQEGVDLGELDRALAALEQVDRDAAVVFQHRWFGGLSMEHIANIVEIEPAEAQRRWTRARKVMRKIMEGGKP
jgi:RNA polymerase sigma factor (TIGR02999 family)